MGTKKYTPHQLVALTNEEYDIEHLAKRLFQHPLLVLKFVDSYPYLLAEHYSKDYTGGRWEYYTSDQNPDVFLMMAPAPKNKPTYSVIVPTNFCDCEMTPRAFGFGITILILNMMIEKNPSDAAIDAFYATRDCALDTLTDEEKTTFLSFID